MHGGRCHTGGSTLAGMVGDLKQPNEAQFATGTTPWSTVTQLVARPPSPFPKWPWPAWPSAGRLAGADQDDGVGRHGGHQQRGGGGHGVIQLEALRCRCLLFLLL